MILIIIHGLGWFILAVAAYFVCENAYRSLKSGNEYHAPKTLKDWYLTYLHLSFIGWLLILFGIFLAKL